jgi:ABC-2 type transport system ATP-binding protein
MKQPVRQLSLGQRMKADIVASLLHNPKLLYLDEPTIGLDVIAKESIRKTIKEINKKYNTTVILTTHDLSDIEELCNRILLIDKGKIIYDGDLHHIKETYGSKKVITFTLKSKEDCEKLDIKKFKTIDKDILTTIQNNTVTIVFNKQKIQIKDLTYHVLNQADVLDIDINDQDLEEIIKAIYKKGIKSS